MKLEPALAEMVNGCQTVCVVECCGLDAFDFSPIHIASHLLKWGSTSNISGVSTLSAQIEALKANYGSKGASACGATIDDLNQQLSGNQIDQLTDELSANLKVAVKLIEESEKNRHQIKTND